ncbi:DUF3500 domain-containing protein [Bremerella sp. JC770]|uniref:DUF3500 domain-containing protein n=1 Tax=Bremerella sp. JC770 TaxID=3232137 RepID=UPI0034595BA8
MPGRLPLVPPNRRDFLQTAAATTAGLALGGPSLLAADETAKQDTPESLVKVLYETLSDKQKQDVTFDWDHEDPFLGKLRTHVENNWNIVDQTIHGNYFTKDQQHLIRQIFVGMVNPDWVEKFDRQLKDDAGGFGRQQNIAIFGKPGEGKFEFVITGRHMTMRCDGNSAEHVAFGGPIFYGHAAKAFNEKSDHPGNVFWHQAKAANKVYEILDGKQQQIALVKESPIEQESGFQGPDAKLSGIKVGDLSDDQKEAVQNVLKLLIEPYRQSDQDEVVACLNKYGGLDACHLSFYEDSDMGNDKVWDNWRLEGPSFVWYFRGKPHVHCWVNVADSHKVPFNAA